MGIVRNTGDNLGGMARLWLARKAVAKPFFHRNTFSCTRAQLQSQFTEIQFITGNAYPQRPSSSNQHGTFRDFKLMVQVNGPSRIVVDQVELFDGTEVVVVGLDHHDTYHLFGQPDWPLTFTSDLDYGGAPAEGQAYTLQMAGLLPLKTPSVLIL